MENKNFELPCEIVEDLLPSYVENLTSDFTNNKIDEHLSDCPSCKEKYNAMAGGENILEDEDRDIDFLKKTRKKVKKTITLFTVLTALVAAAIIGIMFFVSGNDINPEHLIYFVSVDGKNLEISGQSTSGIGIKKISFDENDGVVKVDFSGVYKNLFFSKNFDKDFCADSDIREVWIGDVIVWANGENISPLTSALYTTECKYIGNFSNANKIAQILNISGVIGNYENVLETSEEPYCWNIISGFETTSEGRFYIERKLVPMAYMMIAKIENLDKVHFEYYVDGIKAGLTIDKSQADMYARGDIREACNDVNKLQALIEDMCLDEEDNKMGMEVEHDSFIINVINNADDDIYMLGMNINFGEEYIGQCGMNADNSAINKGDIYGFEITREDWGMYRYDGEKPDDFIKIYIDIYDEINGSPVASECVTTNNLEFGRVYIINLTGSRETGYKLDFK